MEEKKNSILTVLGAVAKVTLKYIAIGGAISYVYDVLTSED